MDLQAKNSVLEPETVHQLRKEIDASIVHFQNIQGQHGKQAGAREIALVVTKLQEAKMWAGKILESLGSELPTQYRDKAE